MVSSTANIAAVGGGEREWRVVHLGVGYALLLSAIWTPRPEQLWLSLAAGVWIVFSVVRTGRDAQQLGLSGAGFRRSAWVVALSLAIAGVMAIAALALGTFHPLFGLLPQVPHAAMYAFWALQQEFILQSFFFIELEAMLGTRRAVVASALLFATAHLPNPLLTVATLGMALLFCSVFARHRNLYALALAHAILGLAVAVSVPDDVHRHMRVGLGYLRYHGGITSAETRR